MFTNMIKQQNSKQLRFCQTEKYLSYPIASRTKIEEDENIKIKDIKVNNPNNPVDLIDAKLITFKLNE